MTPNLPTIPSTYLSSLRSLGQPLGSHVGSLCALSHPSPWSLCSCASGWPSCFCCSLTALGRHYLCCKDCSCTVNRNLLATLQKPIILNLSPAPQKKKAPCPIPATLLPSFLTSGDLAAFCFKTLLAPAELQRANTFNEVRADPFFLQASLHISSHGNALSPHEACQLIVLQSADPSCPREESSQRKLS